jgi:hypothetical protein
MAAPLPPRSDLASSGGPFGGFSEADFRAYEEKKWTSNKFTIERRGAKDKVVALVRAVHAELADPLAGLELHASDPEPNVRNERRVEAQLAYFVRGEQDQQAIRSLVNTTQLSAPGALFDIALHHQHACVLVRLDLEGLRLGVLVAPRAKVDRDNVVEKLKQAWARERVVELASTLPEGARLSFSGEHVESAALGVADVERLAAALLAGADMQLSVLVPRATPGLAGPDAIGLVARTLAPFVPVYRFLAWSRDNEHAHVKETIKKTTEARAKQAIPFKQGDRITILAGLFTGRQGYLEEIDAKGRAKVMVGPISVTVEVKDLAGA